MKRLKNLIITLCIIFSLFIPVKANTTTNLHIHKLRYSNEATLPSVQNTGSEMLISEFGADAELWDNSLYGHVEFKLYKLNESLLPTPLNPTTVAQAVEDAVIAEEPLPYGATEYDHLATGSNGSLTFENVAAGTYVLVETFKPSTVTNHAAPIFIQLPITNAAGTGYLTDVHLYPKNKAVESEITFTKLKWGNNDTSATPYEGVVFDLYKSINYHTDIELVTSGLVTDENGVIKVTGLPVGVYVFVEVSNPLGYRISPRMTNDLGANNLVTEFTSWGSIECPTHSDLADGQVINYEEVKYTLEILNDNANHAFDIGETINFKVTIDMPHNATEYGGFGVTIYRQEIPISFSNIDLDLSSAQLSGVVGTPDVDYEFLLYGYMGITLALQPTAVVNGQDIVLTFSGKIKPEVTRIGTDLYIPVGGDFQDYIYGEDYIEYIQVDVFTFEHTIYVQGKSIFNTANNNIDLPGADFIIGKDLNGTTVYLSYDTDGNVVWQTNISNAQTFTSNVEGNIEIKGLKDGDYFAKQIKAPSGYSLPIFNTTNFTIAPHTAGNCGVTTIENWQSVDLPMTGTLMTAAVVGGLATTLGVAFYFIFIKKEEEEE